MSKNVKKCQKMSKNVMKAIDLKSCVDTPNAELALRKKVAATR